jgi:uncharacterized protein involved in exopolysaccharide biosynthesis
VDDVVAPDTGSMRHWKRVILVPALVGLIAGFLVSYAFPPIYISQSLVLVENQKLPEGLVESVVTGDVSQRLSSMQERILGQSRLLPIVQRLGLAKGNRTADAVIADIQRNFTIEPLVIDSSSLTLRKENDVPGFTLNYASSNPREAKAVCAELTSMLIGENINSREASINSTNNFLEREVEEAKQNLKSLSVLSPERNKSSTAAPEPKDSSQLDRDIERKSASDLLSKLNHALVEARLAEDAEHAQLGEQWYLVSPASLPEDPAFPDRLLFALGGSGAGLVLGLGIAFWLKFGAAND